MEGNFMIYFEIYYSYAFQPNLEYKSDQTD